ncbi:MAG: hypothetical protein IJ734_05515, partial [Fibrobacter sp.]|nr:hypothetical protein [Fibrobacter sp.]
ALLLAASVFADDLVMAPLFTPQALIAKQIAPGTSKIFSISSTFGGCDSCNVSGRTVQNTDPPVLVDDDISGSSYFRMDITPVSYTWPSTANPEGAENWSGHTFGGGFFLNFHYALHIEAGVAPSVVQWFGPIYVGASYELSFGRYYGKDSDGDTDFDKTRHLFTGAANFGAGSMTFMKFHGLGFGLHGGLRQFHIVSAGCSDSESDVVGAPECTADGKQYHIQDWVFYYGIDFIGYTSLPLLKETNSKGHAAYSFTIESGIRTDDQRLMYWSLQWSFML